MGIKVANNAFATLAAGISNSDTSITVSTGQGARFPVLGAGDYFYATLINTSNQLEIVQCTARSTDVLTVVRAQEATVARAYEVGDRIEIRITAQTFADATSNAENFAYTGTLTGGTGVVNLGSGQFYKDASGNVGIGTSSPTTRFEANTGAGGTQNIATLRTANVQLKIGTTDIGNGEATYNVFPSSNSSAAGAHIWQGGGTERMRIDASGNVGIGQTSINATRKVEITQPSGYTSGLRINSSGSGAYFEVFTGAANWRVGGDSNVNALQFLGDGTERARIDSSGNLCVGSTAAGNAGTINVSVGLAGTTTGGIQLWSNTTSTHVIQWGDGTSGTDQYRGYIEYAHNGDSMRFGTSSTERMRIDSSGNLLVGRTALIGSERLSVEANQSTFFIRTRNTASSNPSGMVISYSGASPNNAGNEFIYCEDNTAVRMTVRANGGISNFSGNDANLSDRREKTNFAPAKSYLETICAIPVQTFNYIDQNHEEDPGLTLGVVAQDVQAVAPELVMESNWGTEEEPKMRLSVYQTDLQYALMKCIQEQQAIIESLKARLDAANL